MDRRCVPRSSASSCVTLPDDSVYGCSADSFPFVGRLPDDKGHYIAAGFAGHGMPRILLSTCHVTPLILQDLGIVNQQPECTLQYPPLPQPFHSTKSRMERLARTDLAAKWESEIQDGLSSSKKLFGIPDALSDGVASL